MVDIAVSIKIKPPRWQVVRLLFLILIMAVFYVNAQGAVIIDHTCTDISQIPDYWIQQAKADLRIGYGHTSHGSQLVTGIETFRGNPGSLYYYTGSGWGLVPGIFMNDYWGNAGGADDLGHNGYLGWRDATITMLNLPGNDRNVVIWSWCGGVSDNTVAGINTYLNAMNQLEQAYPGVTFIYMTGHLDGSGTAGNLHLRNEQIRAYCIANNKILFDFADIESYNPDGNGFLGLGADDGCYYNSGNWADEWIAANPGSELAQLASICGSCAHSRCLNCVLKGRAFWWMMARIAGWEGGAGPSMSVTSPTAGRTFGIGRPLSVGWTSSGITGTLKIGLISSDKTNKYLIASAVLYNNSPYSYIIPPDVIPGSYFVIIKQGTLTTRSGNFAIGRISVHSPPGGASYSTGDSLAVSWTAEGISGNVKIFIISTDKSRRYLISASTPYDNSPYSYTIPASVLPGRYVAVVKKDKAYGISGKFTIGPVSAQIYPGTMHHKSPFGFATLAAVTPGILAVSAKFTGDMMAGGEGGSKKLREDGFLYTGSPGHPSRRAPLLFSILIDTPTTGGRQEFNSMKILNE